MGFMSALPRGRSRYPLAKFGDRRGNSQGAAAEPCCQCSPHNPNLSTKCIPIATQEIILKP